MTDHDIAVWIVTEGPEGARPKGIDYQSPQMGYKPHFRIDQGSADYCDPKYAIALCESSAIRYLMRALPPGSDKQMYMLCYAEAWGDHPEWFRIGEHGGPTLLAALHSAIIAIQTGEKK